MKLKKTSVPSAAPGGAAIAERFRLDADSRAGKNDGPSKASATTAFVFGFIALVIMAVITCMMYVNWSVIGPQ